MFFWNQVVCCTSAESNTGTVSHESVKSVVFSCANEMQMHQHRKGAKTHAVSYLIFHIVNILWGFQRFVFTIEMKDLFLLISVKPVLMTAVEKHVNMKSQECFFFFFRHHTAGYTIASWFPLMKPKWEHSKLLHRFCKAQRVLFLQRPRLKPGYIHYKRSYGFFFKCHRKSNH